MTAKLFALTEFDEFVEGAGRGLANLPDELAEGAGRGLVRFPDELEEGTGGFDGGFVFPEFEPERNGELIERILPGVTCGELFEVLDVELFVFVFGMGEGSGLELVEGRGLALGEFELETLDDDVRSCTPNGFGFSSDCFVF